MISDQVINIIILLIIIYFSKYELWLSLIIFCIYFTHFGKIKENFDNSNNIINTNLENIEIPDELVINKNSLEMIKKIVEKNENFNKPEINNQLLTLENYLNNFGEIKLNKQKFYEYKRDMKNSIHQQITQKFQEQISK